MDLSKCRYTDKRGNKFDFSGWKATTLKPQRVIGAIWYANEAVNRERSETIVFQLGEKNMEELTKISDELIEKHKNYGTL